MLLSVNQQNPDIRKIKNIIAVLEKGGVIIYPTDSVYAFGCLIDQPKAINKICKLRNLNPAKANLTLMCKDIKQVASYSKQLDNTVFRMIKQNTPGPVTFILNSNNTVPKLFKNKKRTIGVRVPNQKIAKAILDMLDKPMLSISLKNEDEVIEYFTDPYEIHEDFENRVDIVIDGGFGGNIPSAIVNCVNNEIDLVREGPIPVVL